MTTSATPVSCPRNKHRFALIKNHPSPHAPCSPLSSFPSETNRATPRNLNLLENMRIKKQGPCPFLQLSFRFRSGKGVPSTTASMPRIFHGKAISYRIGQEGKFDDSFLECCNGNSWFMTGKQALYARDQGAWQAPCLDSLVTLSHLCGGQILSPADNFHQDDGCIVRPPRSRCCHVLPLSLSPRIGYWLISLHFLTISA